MDEYPASNGQKDVFSPPNYLEIAARSQTIEAAAGYTEASFTLTGSEKPENVRAMSSIARVLAIAPQIGRWFTSEEEDSGRAVVGIYGVLSYGVAQRTARSASAWRLVRRAKACCGMVLGEAMGLTLAGLGIGLAVSLLLVRYLETLLCRVSTVDPVTYLAVSVAVPAASLMAAFYPARKAMQVDPAISLRS